MSNSTIKHRLFSAFAALTVSMSLAICVTSLSAQKLEPVLDSNTFETISVEIKKIYNLTEVARKIEDFEGIVGRCEKLLKTEISEKDQEYLESLVAWSKNRIAQQHLKNANSMLKSGLTERGQRELQVAANLFDEIVAKHPDAWRAWLGRAKIHSTRGEYELALDKFTQVTKLNRNSKSARFNAAEICLQLNRHDQANEHYTWLIDNDPTDAQAITGRGHSNFATENFDEAISDYKTVIKLLPGNENALCNLADAFFAIDKCDEALEYYNAAAKVDDSTLGKERLANFLVTSKDKDLRNSKRAVALTKEAIAVAGASAERMKMLSSAYAANGEQALADQALWNPEEYPLQKAEQRIIQQSTADFLALETQLSLNASGILFPALKSVSPKSEPVSIWRVLSSNCRKM